MNALIHKHADSVIGVLSGFDRLVLRGTLRSLVFAEGMFHHLCAKGILLKDFSPYVQKVTSRIRAAVEQTAERTGRPVIYLPSSKTDKEKLAHGIAERDRIQEGLVCVLSCVEPCASFEIHRNHEARRLQLKARLRKCLHLYQYWIHPLFGSLNIRIQTWFPLSIQICMNGREWLSRQMDRAGIAYIRRDNTFTWVEDYDRTQRLMDRQLTIAWPRHLRQLARIANPVHREVLGPNAPDYYWSAYQSEWATDISFRSRSDLERLYPSLIHHGITTFQSDDVMRFLGRAISPSFRGEVISDVKRREEGVRIKHHVDDNSVKVYDKNSNLRVETTINTPRDFKVFRAAEGDPDGPLAWRPMRKGIADLHRRAQLCQSVNDRYLHALASVEATTTMADLVRDLTRPASLNGARLRPMNPWAEPDVQLLQAVSRGEFTVRGFRNRDLRPLLFHDTPTDPEHVRRQSSATTRRIRLLRAHGLVTKLPHTHRYQLTPHGRIVISAILAAHSANAEALTKLAA